MTTSAHAIARVLALPVKPPAPEPVERAPARYDHLDFKPTPAMARAAARGLELRRQHGRGGTAVGVARARDLKNRRTLSPGTVRRMKAYFDRHRGDRDAEGSDSGGYWGNADNPSAGWIAWLLWGGDPGRAWASRLVRQMEQADEDAERTGKGAVAAPAAVCRAPAWLTPRAPVQRRSASERARQWRSWVRRVQSPAERRLGRLWASYLKGQAERTAARLEASGVLRSGPAHLVRNIRDDELMEVLALREEAAIAAEEIGVLNVRRVVTGGFREVLAAVPGLTFDPTLDPSGQLLAQAIVQVAQSTKDRVAGLIAAALADGWTVAEAQSALIQDFSFSPVRALRIARTESTRALNEGSGLAYADAADQGVALRVEWLSARDSAVRPSHEALDGQQVAPGELFAVPVGFDNAGDSARFPGDFSAAGEVVNCRCTTLPVLQ